MTRWDCHDHRDELNVSDSCTVYHQEQGVLCYGEKCKWNLKLYHPIVFKSKAAANKWIESGCISEIQESFRCLDIGFRKTNILEF